MVAYEGNLPGGAVAKFVFELPLPHPRRG